MTANEREFLEIIRTAKDPENAIKLMSELLTKFLDKNSVTSQIIELMTKKYSSITEFAEALGWTEEKTVNIMLAKVEPTLEEVSTIAKALDKEPERVALIFIEQSK